MKSKDYIPSVESKFLPWAENFTNVLANNDERWRISHEEVTKLNELFVNFKQKYAVAENPATRTKAAVQSKNDAKKDLIAGIRRVYRMYLLYNDLVTNEDRDLLQLPIHDARPTSITPPSTVPIGSIGTSTHQKHRLTVVDSVEVRARGGLPDGVHGFQAWYKIGGVQPTTDEEFAYLGSSSTSVLTVDFPLVEVGKTVWYRFRWVNNKNQPGPWSEIVGAVIP